jgi:hypothetical protein
MPMAVPFIDTLIVYANRADAHTQNAVMQLLNTAFGPPRTPLCDGTLMVSLWYDNKVVACCLMRDSVYFDIDAIYCECIAVADNTDLKTQILRSGSPSIFDKLCTTIKTAWDSHFEKRKPLGILVDNDRRDPQRLMQAYLKRLPLVYRGVMGEAWGYKAYRVAIGR